MDNSETHDFCKSCGTPIWYGCDCAAVMIKVPLQDLKCLAAYAQALSFYVKKEEGTEPGQYRIGFHKEIQTLADSTYKKLENYNDCIL